MIEPYITLLATRLIKSALDASANNVRKQSLAGKIAGSPDSGGEKASKTIKSATLSTASFQLEDTSSVKKDFTNGTIRIPTSRPVSPIRKPKPPKVKVEKKPVAEAPLIPVRFKESEMSEITVDGGGKKGNEEKLISLAVDRLKKELPEILKEYLKSLPVTATPKELDTVYLNQIAAAQEFLNENSKADLSRIKCLLWKMFPKEYHDVIDCLKQHQDPQVIINIHGGQNVIAPKAMDVQQG